MSRQFCFFAAVLLVFAAVAGSSIQAKTFVSRTGYQVTTPKNWMTQPGPGDSKVTMTFYCATGKNGRLALPVIDVLTRPMEMMTMTKLVSFAPGMVAGNFPNFRQTYATYTLIGGTRAYDIRGTYPRGSRAIFVRELFTTHSGKAYIVTTAFPIQQRAAYEATSNQVIASIRWR